MSTGIRTSIQVNDMMSPAFRSMNNAMNMVINSFEHLQTATQNPMHIETINAARAAMAQTEVTLNQVENEINNANRNQRNFNDSMRNGQVAAGGLAQKIMGFVAAYAGLEAIKKIGSETDDYTNQGARLAMINDGTQTQLELQNKIFQAAQRARGEYGATVNTVAKLGLLAKDAFKGNDETIRFAELMTKSFKISGASSSEATNGMYQLTQALAAGKLQGDEFRSVMENAPMVAQAIAKFTGKSMGDLKKMSAEGTITADIIKNAMFMAADDIEGKFATMPMTFGAVWTSIKNMATMRFAETMTNINGYLNSVDGKTMVKGVTDAVMTATSALGALIGTLMVVTSFVSGNWDILTPIIWGVVAAIVAYNTVAAITNGINAISAFRTAASGAAAAFAAGSTWAQVVAQEGLNAALYACPITWIVMGIIALIVIFYAAVAAVNHFAGTSLSATGIIAGAFVTVGAIIGNAFIAAFNLIMDAFGVIWNFIANFAEFFANVFNDPIGSIVRLFTGMAGSILEIIQGIASAMDTLFGSNLASAVDGWQSKLQGMTNDVVGEAKIKVQRIDPSKNHIDRLEYGKAFNIGNQFGKSVEAKLNLSKMFGGSSEATDALRAAQATAANTGAMKDSVKATSEDMKYLRDIAEKETINKFTTAKIKVEAPISAQINNEMDLDGVVAHLENKVYETMQAASEGVHS